MKESYRMLFFISTFITIILLINIFIFYQYSRLFDTDYFNWLIIIILSVQFMLCVSIDRKFNNLFTGLLLLFSAIVFGSTFVFFSVMIVASLIFFITNLSQQMIGYGALYLSLILVLYSLINARRVRVKKIKISGFGKKLRAVQLTDLHIGSINTCNYLKKIVDITNNLNPNVVFVTGDLVSGNKKMTTGLFDDLKYLKAKTYFVYGNHEYYEGIPEFNQVVKSTGMEILQDRKVKFKDFDIYGLDYKDKQSIDIKTDILLAHAPIYNKNAKLTLSGHTHAGQIFPFNIFVRLNTKYVTGLYTENNGKNKIYVSPGTSTWGPPMRLGSINEITLIEID